MQISLKAARINAEFTQKELAKKLNRNESTIVNWENGKTKISLIDFKNMCKVLKMKEDSIFLSKKSSLT